MLLTSCYPFPKMNNNPCLGICCSAALILSGFSQLIAQNSESITPAVKPALQWKYGWKDGSLANTIGRFRGGHALPAASSYTSTGYIPSQISRAYGFDQIATNGDGRGQIIAIIDAYGSSNIQSDLNAFCAQYGLPVATVSVVYPSGKPSVQDAGWAGESTLDVEWAHAMAPGASIVLVVAPNAGISSLIASVNYAVSTLKANVVSMSWGATEFLGELNYDSSFNKSGVTFVASSGDTGGIVDWPASSPFVLGVGGTTLLYNSSSGLVSSEVAWSGSGGGKSPFEALPSDQAGWNVNPGRGIPDVAYNADPYTGVSVFFTDPTKTNSGGWYIFGGTSAGAPQWSALISRRASLGNNSSIAGFQTLLYGAAKTNYASLLRDIISGSNGYRAVTGFDLVTGLGSPLAAKVVQLPSVLPTPTPTPKPSPTPSPTPTPKPSPTPSPKPTPSPRPTPPRLFWWQN